MTGAKPEPLPANPSCREISPLVNVVALVWTSSRTLCSPFSTGPVAVPDVKVNPTTPSGSTLRVHGRRSDRRTFGRQRNPRGRSSVVPDVGHEGIETRYRSPLDDRIRRVVIREYQKKIQAASCGSATRHGNVIRIAINKLRQTILPETDRSCLKYYRASSTQPCC